MKKSKLFVVYSILMMLVLSACGSANYVISGGLGKIKIEVNNVEDGKYAESGAFSFSKNKPITVESALDKGELQIEFAYVINMADPDEVDDYVITDIAQTVTVKPGDTLEITVDYSQEYELLLTAIGNTNGTVNITY
mgnify:CR=1 FL=1